MKKNLLTVLAIFAFYASMAQEKTFNITYYKPKMGHRNDLIKAISDHNSKYRPAGGPYSIVAYNLVGGEHNNEILILTNVGKSFKDRDLASPAPKEATDNLYATVHPHVEAITAGDVLVYKKEYSNSAFNERAEKTITTTYFLKYNIGNDFWDVVKKLPAAWDKAGVKIAAYTPTTGSSRLFFARRFINGWAELDNNSNLSKAYDEVYGKGAFDKDIQIFRAGVERKDATMMTMSKDMTSK